MTLAFNGEMLAVLPAKEIIFLLSQRHKLGIPATQHRQVGWPHFSFKEYLQVQLILFTVVEVFTVLFGFVVEPFPPF